MKHAAAHLDAEPHDPAVCAALVDAKGQRLHKQAWRRDALACANGHDHGVGAAVLIAIEVACKCSLLDATG